MLPDNSLASEPKACLICLQNVGDMPLGRGSTSSDPNRYQRFGSNVTTISSQNSQPHTSSYRVGNCQVVRVSLITHSPPTISSSPANLPSTVSQAAQQKLTPSLVLECGHRFCLPCLKAYLCSLVSRHMLYPEHLVCPQHPCPTALSDQAIITSMGSEQGYMVTAIRKKYQEAQHDRNVVVFCCPGLVGSDRKALLEKAPNQGREEYCRRITSHLRNVKKDQISVAQAPKGQTTPVNKVGSTSVPSAPSAYRPCTSIHSSNRNKISTSLQCYVCGAAVCGECLDIKHDGQKCVVMNQDSKNGAGNNSNTTENTLNPHGTIEDYLLANKYSRCMNPTCRLPIAKEEGCFWVKCRCGWEMCHPCQTIWGDCQHFAKYPYQKFVPPPQWMERAIGRMQTN